MQKQNPGTDSRILTEMETISGLQKWSCFVQMTHRLFYSLGFILNISRDSPYAIPLSIVPRLAGKKPPTFLLGSWLFRILSLPPG